MAILWEDRALVLSLGMIGESRLRVTLMSEHNGLYSAVLRGGRRTNVGVTPGALVWAKWSARIAEHMGTADVVLQNNPTVQLWHHATALDVASAAFASCALMPEREPYPALFPSMMTLLDHLCQISADASPNSDDGQVSGLAAAKQLVAWELAWLNAMGFGLRLHTCAVHGSASGERLSLVSPRSGHAVCRLGAKGWEHRLLALPNFVRDISARQQRGVLAPSPRAASSDSIQQSETVTASEMLAALHMTGVFTHRAVQSMGGVSRNWGAGARARVLSSLAPNQTPTMASHVKQS